MAEEKTTEKKNDHAAGGGIEDRQSGEDDGAGAFRAEIDQSQAGEGDRHHAGEGSGADPEKSLDETEFFLVKFDGKQLEPLLGAGDETIAERAERTDEAGRSGGAEAIVAIFL